MPHKPALAHRTPARPGLRPALATAIAIALLSVLALASSAAALEQQVGVVGNDAFGYSVAVQGDTLVIGSPPERSTDPGAAYVYQRAGDAWNQTAELIPSDTAPGDRFGWSVAIDGDTIVVGAPGATIGVNTAQGAIYTFTRTGTPDRTETAKLTVADGFAQDQLGVSVAIDGDTIVSGAPGVTVGKNAIQGAIYTFTRDGAGDRTETAKLTASDGAADAQIGQSVAIDGDTIVAGAPGGNASKGSAYTFARTGSPARAETAKLSSSQAVVGDSLGQSVAIDGDTIVVGAPRAFLDGIQKGVAFTFTRTGASVRTEAGSLSAFDGVTGSFLGLSVAIDGDTVLAGAPLDTIRNNAAQGSAYTFSRTGLPARRQTSTLRNTDGAANDFFGLSVALDAGTTVVGAPGRGFVSVFFSPAPPPPPPPPPPPAPARPPPPPSTTPVLSALQVTPATIHVASAHSKPPRRGAITFVLSTAASVTLRFAGALPGRVAGTKCETPSRANQGNRHCTRMFAVRSLAVHGHEGTNSIALARTLLRRTSPPIGRYRLTATPTSASGINGTARTATFRIAK